MSEWAIYRTAKIGPGVLSPVIVSSRCPFGDFTDTSNIPCLDADATRLLQGLEENWLSDVFHHN